MPTQPRDEEREQRIMDEIIVDAYAPDFRIIMQDKKFQSHADWA